MHRPARVSTSTKDSGDEGLKPPSQRKAVANHLAEAPTTVNDRAISRRPVLQQHYWRRAIATSLFHVITRGKRDHCFNKRCTEQDSTVARYDLTTIVAASCSVFETPSPRRGLRRTRTPSIAPTSHFHLQPTLSEDIALFYN